ncbi:MAG: hypothetical protein JWR83_3296 [Aeromicrobium sp.]|nr:hypothetical protein [Aeromicrobium sp.]
MSAPRTGLGTRFAAYAAATLTFLAGTVLVAAPASADEVDAGGITYTYDAGNIAAGATVESYTGGPVVAIPSTVPIPVAPFVVTVKQIGSGAFENDGLTGVTIPDSVTAIDDDAFNHNSLTHVTIPNGVTTIGDSALADNDLADIAIPNSVTALGDSAFSSNSLTGVTIPNSVTTLGDYAFDHNNLTTVSIGNSVATIGHDAFNHNGLTGVTIPNSVTTIGGYAFNNNYLADVSIGNSVDTIGEAAFAGNVLTTVSIPHSVTTIGDYAFAGNVLTNVSMSNGVTTIGDYAFGNNNLANITIPDSVTTIGDSAFMVNKLTGITLPKSVTTIGNSAFNSNPDLTSVRFLGAAPTLTIAHGGNESFDTVSGSLVLHFPASEGVYTTPTWLGYDTMRGLAPTISGTPREGQTLTANTGTTVPAGAVITTFIYKWYANRTLVQQGTSATLLLAKVSAGRRISVTITSNSPGLDTETKSSPPTALVSSPYRRLVLSAHTVHRGQHLVVTATGLKPDQTYTIQLDNKTRAFGRADTHGTVNRSVTFASNTETGSRTVRVIAKRSGSKPAYSISTTVKYDK